MHVLLLLQSYFLSSCEESLMTRKPNDWFDFLEIELMYWSHLRLFWIVIPKYFDDFTKILLCSL